MKYTPAPWKRKNIIIGDNEFLRAFIKGKSEGKYIQIIPNMNIEDHEDEANINLIAAAPEMYEALKDICNNCDNPGIVSNDCKDYCSVIKVLNKAEGVSD